MMMRRFPPELIEQVRLTSDIVDLIGEDTFLKKSGSRFMGLCPFPGHQEKTPSFSVSPDKQMYHCFGCQESGDIYTYLQARRGLKFYEAVEFLARRAAIPLPAHFESPESKKLYQKRKNLFEITGQALRWFENNLKKPGGPAWGFMKKRGFSPSTVKDFRLGYAPQGWEGLCRHLEKSGLSLWDGASMGLVKKKDGGGFYDVFRNRVMFPIFARNGKDVVGFGGRVLDQNPKAPKYINSADSDIFHKGKTFYGWDKSTMFMRNQGKALVVEGYTDFITLYQGGVKNVVATLGTALTSDHARRLAWYAEEVILFFDGDMAGGKAMDRSLGLLLSAGLTPKRLDLKKDQDPDSFVRTKGGEALRKKLNQAEDLFLYHLQRELKTTSAGWDKFPVAERMAHLLTQTKNQTLKDYYSQRVLDIFGTDAAIAQKALNRVLKKQDPGRGPQPQGAGGASSFAHRHKTEAGRGGASKAPFLKQGPGGHPAAGGGGGGDLVSLSLAPRSELYLLILALQSRDFYLPIVKSGVLKCIYHPGLKKMFDLLDKSGLKNVESSHFPLQAGQIRDHCSEPHLLFKDRYPVLQALTKEQTPLFIRDCIDKVEKKGKQMQVKSLMVQLQTGPENQKQHLQKILKLTRKNKTENTNPKNI